MKRYFLFVVMFPYLIVCLAAAQQLEIHHINVGQGDATLIKSPTGVTMLIDGGNTGKGKNVVFPYLSSLGITFIDYVVCSHYDADHLGGLDEVIDSLGSSSIGSVYDRGSGGKLPTSIAYKDYVAAVNSTGRRHTAELRQIIDLGGGVIMKCVAADGKVINYGLVSTSIDEENDRSLGWLLNYDSFQYFTGGDLGGESGTYADSETPLAHQVGDVDVFKVDHHGSLYSTNQTFVDALKPEVGIIDVGDGNTYHHPVQSTLDRLVAANCYIYQTELGTGGTIPSGKGTVANGNIIVTTSGTSYTVTFGDSTHSYPGDSSGSQDSLAPRSPQNPALIALINGPIQVRWDHNHADIDMKNYIVYRSTQSGFPLADSTRITSTTDSTIVDSTTHIGDTYYYKVTAVDFHGNESAPSTEQSATALPIQLSEFSGHVNSENSVIVEWTTTSEVNSLGFYVERRNENEQTFLAMSDLIAGAGTSLEQHQYSWIDANVGVGTYYYRLHQIDLDNAETYSNGIKIVVTGALAVKCGSMPRAFALDQNYPNPFNPATMIRYEIPVPSYVTLKVYNTLGQEIAALVNGQQEPGYKSVNFNAGKLASGVYYYRLQAGFYTEVKKMLIVK